MNIKPEWIIGGVVTGCVAGLVAYLAHYESGDMVTQPTVEPASETVFAALNAHVMEKGVDMGDNHARHEWRRPDYDMQNDSVIKMPVRYPRVPGQNLNAIIHHGWDALNRPAPQDGAWLENPPADVVI